MKRIWILYLLGPVVILACGLLLELLRFPLYLDMVMQFGAFKTIFLFDAIGYAALIWWTKSKYQATLRNISAYTALYIVSAIITPFLFISTFFLLGGSR